jgi:hypothetical protein
MPAIPSGTVEQTGGAAPLLLGPRGPFPRAQLQGVLERRWLHYAFLGRHGDYGMVANIAWLGSPPHHAAARPRNTAILLLHRGGEWCATQYSAEYTSPAWSAFRQPHPFDEPRRLVIRAPAGVAVDLNLSRTSRPCTSQCAPFAEGHHLRWQSETGVVARGRWNFGGDTADDVEAIGYHERVRGYWGWPELGGWVFGFANSVESDAEGRPDTAVVFTLIQPERPAGATTGSVMLWRRGRMRRHFPRRNITVAVRGCMNRNRVTPVPWLASLLSVDPAGRVPQRLAIAARSGADRLLIDFHCSSAARVVVPSETSIQPFSVHEVIGPVSVSGNVGGQAISFETRGIVEFAGGAHGD